MSVLQRLKQLDRRVVACERCPRLREHCQAVAERRRAAYRDWTYWGRPVPNFYDQRGAGPRLLVVGLAPAAHGANRTGRMFTGDKSGDFLYRAMHEAGSANQPTATDADDGLRLIDAAITAAAHCAPPANKPTPAELVHCQSYLDETFDILLPRLRVVVALGQIGHQQVLRLYQRRGWVRRLADYRFAHGAEHHFADAPTLLDSYHPSQQNTFTGRLTAAMLRAVFERAAELGGASA